MGRQNRAKRASRAVLELAMLLSDGNWHSTSYLGIAAGKYMRPEIAWRRGRGNIDEGRRLSVNLKLDVWERAGRVEKRRNGRYVEWRLAKTEWVIPYLRVLIKALREQLNRHYEQPVGKARTLLERIEREREIIRLREEGFSQRRIAERVGCHQATVQHVLKAAKAEIQGDDISSPLPLYHRMAIADAPLEKQAEIAKAVAEKRLTLEKTKRLIRLAMEGNEHD